MISKRKILLGAITAAFCVANVGFSVENASAQDAAQQQAAPAPARGKLVGAYRGVLPCADCPGIDTTVRLFAAADGAESHGRYVIRSSYQERNTTNTEMGTWTLEKGTPADPAASVYVLKSKTGNGVTNYLVVSDNEITQLDANRKPFTGTINFTLKKVAANASKHAAPAA